MQSMDLNHHELHFTPAEVSWLEAEYAEPPSGESGHKHGGGGGSGGGGDDEPKRVYRNVASGRGLLKQTVTLVPVRFLHLAFSLVVELSVACWSMLPLTMFWYRK